MPSTIVIYRLATGLLWALALWHAWLCRGLFVDGSTFLVEIVRREWFFDFYDPRLYAMVLGQIPIMIGVKLGITDLHWLARLLSLGLFALPTIFYHLALNRARHDAVLLCAVIAAIAIVFLTTSFFIVGEYNTIYSIVIMIAVRLATAERLTWQDGLVLALTGVLAIRTYEATLYLGPLLAAMICWRVWTLRAAPSTPQFFAAVVLHLVSAVCLIAGSRVAYYSIAYPFSEEHLSETVAMIHHFWQNMQFMLVLTAATTLAVWALVRPADLAVWKPYRWAAVWMVLLALSPLLAISEGQIRPLAKSQYVARTLSGGLIAAIVVAIWIYASHFGRSLTVMKMLRLPAVERRILVFSCALFLSVLPSDIYLTASWTRYLDAFRDTVQTRSGLIAFEDSPLAKRPHIFMVENWTLPSASLALRAKEGSSVVLPPHDFKDWQPFDAVKWYPDLGRYFWRH